MKSEIVEEEHEEDIAFWSRVSSVLGFEVTDAVTPKEIEKIVLESNLIGEIEALEIVSEISNIGRSRNRRERAMFSSLLIGVYLALVGRDSARVEEIARYLEERLRDVEKQVRENCVYFILRHSDAIREADGNRITKSVIDLLKNSSRKVRVFYLKVLCSNSDQFASMLRTEEVKQLFRALYRVQGRSLEGKADMLSVKKVLELAGAMVARKKAEIREFIHLCDASASFELSSMNVAKMVSKDLQEEVVKSSYLDVLAEKKRKERQNSYKNMMQILEWCVCRTKKVFMHYTNLVSGGKLRPDMMCALIKMLCQSPLQQEKAPHLAWVENKLEEKAKEGSRSEDLFEIEQNSINQTRNRHVKEPSAGAEEPSISELLEIYSVYVKKGDVSEKAFIEKIEKLCREGSVDVLKGVCAILEDITKSPSQEMADFIRKYTLKTLAHPELLENVVKSVDLIAYLQPAEILSVQNLSNPVNFYLLLWYINSIKADSENRCREHLIKDVKVLKIAHKEFDLLFEFFVLLFKLKSTFPPNSHLFAIHAASEHELSRYFSSALEEVRRSREALLEIYHEIVASLKAATSSFYMYTPKEFPAALYFASKNAQCIFTLLLYTMNRKDSLFEIQSFIEKVRPPLYEISREDTETITRYGVLNKKTKHTFQKIVNLIKPLIRPEHDISSVTDLTISTNLDTNIIEEHRTRSED